MTAATPRALDPLLVQLGWTLLHFLWQGAALATLFWFANLLLRRRSAHARYACGCATLLLMAAAPVVTFRMLDRPGGGAAARAPVPSDQLDKLVTLPFLVEPRAAAPVLPVTGARAEPRRHWADRVRPLMPWVVSTWCVGVIVMAARRLAGWIWLSVAVRTRSLPLREPRLLDLARRLVRRPVRFLQTALVDAPATFGVIRPVILLPASTLSGLTPQQLEAIIVHELAHVRRFDYLVNVLQAALEAALFYHPAVWWVSRRVRLERENCCDDAAVAVVGDRTLYARALERLETLRTPPPLQGKLALSARGGNLVERIGRLLGVRPYDAAHVGPGTGAVWVIACAALLLPAVDLLAQAAAEREEQLRLRGSVAGAVYRVLGVAENPQGGALAGLEEAQAARAAGMVGDDAVLAQLAGRLNAGGRADDLVRACLARMRVDDPVRYQARPDWPYGTVLDRHAMLAGLLDRARPASGVDDETRRLFARGALLLAAQDAWLHGPANLDAMVNEQWLVAAAGLEDEAVDAVRASIERHLEVTQRFAALRLQADRIIAAAGARSSAAAEMDRTLRSMAQLAKYRPDLQWHVSNVTWRYASRLPADQRRAVAATGARLATELPSAPHFARWIADATRADAPPPREPRPIKAAELSQFRNRSKELRDAIQREGEAVEPR